MKTNFSKKFDHLRRNGVSPRSRRTLFFEEKRFVVYENKGAKMRKGVTPVVAVILLLLITVAIVGFAFTFLQRTVTTAAERGQNQTGELGAAVGESFRIENAAGSSVVVRNTGIAALNTASLSVYINNVARTCTWSPASIAVNSVGTCTLASACSAGDSVRVVGASYEDRVTCE